jgi:RNA polymerase sigma-70 factor (ECF subfamily)
VTLPPVSLRNFESFFPNALAARRSIAPGYWESLYSRASNRGGKVELFAFDKAYVERLRDGDPATEHHFVSYFEQLLRIKLRARALPSHTVDELRQETFIRVISALRKEGGVREPERLGAFVNSICNNVLMEFYRSRARTGPLEDHHLESSGKVLDLEGLLLSKEVRDHVRRVLGELPERDRRVLSAMFLEDKDKDEACHDLGVDRDYLRVLFHRAKDKFKVFYQGDQQARGFGATRRAAKGNL